jgi:hypothetical protein
MAHTAFSAISLLSRPPVLIAALAGIMLAGTLALWAHYGTAVFYEMISRRDRRLLVSWP